jgi:hypothetical protein
MQKKKLLKDMTDEKGSILIIALMIFFVSISLGMSIIKIAAMEKKISHYALNMQQAQQAADAGVEWAIEKIYQGQIRQGDYLGFKIGSETFSFTIEDVAEEPHINGYSFKSTGLFNGVAKSLQVALSNCYLIDDEGNINCQRGQISSYIIISD